MKRNKIVTLGTLIVGTTTVFAGTEMDALKDRITELENSATKVEISGAISVNYAKGNQTDKEIYVDGVEIGIATSIADGFNANIVFLAEVDDDADNELKNPVIDEITIGGSINSVDFSIGKQSAPFGAYESMMISNATEGMGDTGTKSLILSTEVGGITLSAWSGSSKNRGFSIGYEGGHFAVGVDTIRDAGGDAQKQSDIVNNKGTAIHGQFSINNVTLIAEKVAVKTPSANKAHVTSVEAQYTMSDFTVALRKDSTDDATNADATLFAVGYEFTEGLGLTIENFNPKAAGKDTVMTANLAYEF
ncbi:hypothetical protein CRYPD_1148 [uncultured Candidatus Thioglobus sp.]|nr:hypothetical protein CRYPD_1148 [uncultured Candidatus Thioglobus sp.]